MRKEVQTINVTKVLKLIAFLFIAMFFVSNVNVAHAETKIIISKGRGGGKLEPAVGQKWVLRSYKDIVERGIKGHWNRGTEWRRREFWDWMKTSYDSEITSRDSVKKFGSKKAFQETCSYPNGDGSEWVAYSLWIAKEKASVRNNFGTYNKVIPLGTATPGKGTSSKFRGYLDLSMSKSEKEAIKKMTNNGTVRLNAICAAQMGIKPDVPPDNTDFDPTPTPTKEVPKVTNTCPVPDAKTVTKANPDAEIIKGVYATYGKIIANRPLGFNGLSESQRKEWEATHEDQVIPTQLTELGELLKSLGVGFREFAGTGTANIDPAVWEANKDKIKAAAKKSTKDITLNLSAKNKQGFANGGLFTVVQNELPIEMSVSSATDYKTVYTCKYSDTEKTLVGTYPKSEYNKPTAGEGIEIVETATDWKVYKKKAVTSSSTAPTGTKVTGIAVSPKEWKLSKSYQLIGVRCNTSKLKSSLGEGTIISQTVSSGKMSAAAKSPVVLKRLSTHFNNLNNISFFYYGRGCDLNCTPSKGTDRNNDNVNNVGKSTSSKMTDPSSFGAQADNKVSSKFQFFRDNVYKDVRSDIWRLADPAIKELKNVGNKAHRTAISADPEGTPKHKEYSVLGVSNNREIEVMNGERLREVWVTSGQINKFRVKSDWASNAGEPHKININYVYRPTLTAYVPLEITTSGQIKKGGSVGSNIDYVCTNRYNTVNPKAAQVYINTISNEDLKGVTRYSWNTSEDLEFHFVKSSKE